MIARNILGFSVTQNMQRIMNFDGFFASIMRSEKQTNDTGKLPPGMPIPVLPVDYLKDKPDFWIGGKGSYVCPVDSNWALWFNWSMNNSDVAILTSVKGMNPLTGQRINGIGLEQYQKKCPIHNCDLQHGNFCPECNYKWPNQNYICDPNPMYLDGFRSDDGHVRQFYFTEDMAKSIPELVIGMDDTVPAFGFCFYKLKKQNTEYEDGKRLKQIPEEGSSQLMFGKGLIDKPLLHVKMKSMERSGIHTYFSSCVDDSKGLSLRSRSFSTSSIIGASMENSLCERSIHDIDYDDAVPVGFSNEESINKSTLEVGVGAGAQIRQRIVSDRHEVNEWSDKPKAIMRIYFVFREQFEKYVASGLKDLVGCKEGFLDSLPVGGNNE